ncbi:MAG: hypothetical protein JNK64_05360 [Myxococcales bacterium]|nr:hypothetical protein [Myxococcales bacterium]
MAGAFATTALLGSAGAQPAPPPPAPPAPPAGPRPPKPPKPPKAPTPGQLDARIKAEFKKGIAEAIRDIEGEDGIPDAIKARILDSLKRAQASGNPGDLADLSQLGNLRGLDDLGDMINGEIERALKQAGKHGNVRIGKRGVTIDLSDDDHQWSWSWDDDQASPFDDPNLGWLKGTPFAPGDDDFDIPDPPDPPDFDDLDVDLDIDLDDVQLDAGKIAALEKIAADEEKATRPAQKKVVELGRQLKKVVGGADPNQAEIDRLVDAITAEEAKIRKARLGALTQSRKVIGK